MKLTRIAAVGLISATLAVGGLAGCGSSSSSSSGSDTTAADTTAADTTATTDTTGGSDFVAAATQVCTDGIAAMKAAADAGDTTTIEGLQATLQSTADAAKASLEQLQALEPPADQADAYQAFIDAQTTVVTNAEDLATKIGSETDLDAAQAEVVKAGEAEAENTAAAESAAKALGLDACAG